MKCLHTRRRGIEHDERQWFVSAYQVHRAFDDALDCAKNAGHLVSTSVVGDRVQWEVYDDAGLLVSYWLSNEPNSIAR